MGVPEEKVERALHDAYEQLEYAADHAETLERDGQAQMIRFAARAVDAAINGYGLEWPYGER